MRLKARGEKHVQDTAGKGPVDKGDHILWSDGRGIFTIKLTLQLEFCQN